MQIALFRFPFLAFFLHRFGHCRTTNNIHTTCGHHLGSASGGWSTRDSRRRREFPSQTGDRSQEQIDHLSQGGFYHSAPKGTRGNRRYDQESVGVWTLLLVAHCDWWLTTTGQSWVSCMNTTSRQASQSGLGPDPIHLVVVDAFGVCLGSTPSGPCVTRAIDRC